MSAPFFVDHDQAEQDNACWQKNKPMINAGFPGSAWATTPAQFLPRLAWLLCSLLLWYGSFYSPMMMILVIFQRNLNNF